MQASSFNPGSLFGVPVTSFPPGMQWSSRRELLHELMNDLHRGWVQDYLLRSNASADARILSSPAQLSKSLSFTFKGYVDSPRPENLSVAGMRGTVLAVPAFTRDDISAGICVESTDANDAPTEIMSRAIRFTHYSHNDRTGSLCIISDDGDDDVVEMDFFAPASHSNKLALKLRFDSELFAKAFISGSVNFELLENSMLSMCVGYLIADPRECIEAQAPSCHVPRRKWSIVDHLSLGDNYAKCVLSMYEKSVLVKAVPVFAHMSRKTGAEDSVLTEMVCWGMTDRLGRLKPIPQASISTRSEDYDVLETSAGLGLSAHDVDNILFGPNLPELHLPEIQEVEEAASQDNETISLRISRPPENNRLVIPSKLSSTTSLLTTSVQPTPSEVPPFLIGLQGPKRNKVAVRIAPAPFTFPNYTAKHNEGRTWVQLLEKERLAKAHRRKLRKREAAFRSNAKRSEQRRLARLAQKND